MKTMFSRLASIAWFAALLMLAACTSRNGQASLEESHDTRCSQQASSCNVLSGYSANSAASGIGGATIAGGGMPGSPNQVSGNAGTIGGGVGNTAGEGSTVGGGTANTALYFHATVSGGANNLAEAEEASVGGGFKNTASDRFATVGGGASNTASDIASTVGGGSGNLASSTDATVGGGVGNLAGNLAAVVPGGNHNLAQGTYSAILGGVNNTASGSTASIGGGAGNVAAGLYATIPGGFANQANANYSLAAGRSAQIGPGFTGTFLFADASPFPFLASAADEFAVRATGGVRFITAIGTTGSPLAGVRLSPGSGAWDTLSDAAAKAGFASVNGNQILDQLDSIPISTWYYRGQDPAIRHIGPTAQDFQAAFHLGQDDHYISTVDEEGVTLAAVQQLYRLVRQDQAAGNPAIPSGESALRAQVSSLRAQLSLSNGLTAAALLAALLAFWRSGKRTSRP